MGIRLPLKKFTFNDANELGAGSVAGGVAHTFTIPQDTDNIVVKMTASAVGGGVSTILQTTDDGGTTWYDVARTSIVTNANATTAEWITASTVPATAAIGTAASSALAGGGESGLPLLSTKGRVFIVLTGNQTSAASNSLTTKVLVNSESQNG